MTWTIVVLVVLVLVVWGFYVSWRASRLDRLHNRVEAARTALDLALVRRCLAASELASSGLLDPATSLLLADAARRAKQAGQPERDLAESDLTRALRATVGDPGVRAELAAADPRPHPDDPHDADDADDADDSADLLTEVESAAQQVFIARKFYNDVAGRTIDARRRPLARAFHLSGSAQEPKFFEMDDVITVAGANG